MFPYPIPQSPKRKMRNPEMSQARINGWIAFSEHDEHLIAHGATYDEVVASAGKQGASDLIVVKVPETWIYRVSVANGAARAR